jgi:hypothetical protein
MKAIIASAAFVLCTAPALAAGPTPQSAAQAFEVQITSDGVITKAGPFARASGYGGNPYSISTVGTPEQDVIALLPLSPAPSLYLNLGAAKASASNTGILVDNESWGSKAQIDSVQAAINLNPPPPAARGPFPQPFLNITAKDVKADAGLSVVFPSTHSANGNAHIGNLTITGSAISGSTVHFNGNPTVNKVIFDSPTVTITLNERVLGGVITCTPCMFTPYLIETNAVDIALNKAPWRGNKYSGHIIIARATAGK